MAQSSYGAALWQKVFGGTLFGGLSLMAAFLLRVGENRVQSKLDPKVFTLVMSGLLLLSIYMLVDIFVHRYVITKDALEVYRPWGYYDSIDAGPRFQVKRIVVNPGASLSLQMHHHRAEHWIVVSGTARVTCGENILLLSENQSTYIPLGTTHRLENPGKLPLEMIEVQSGSYLGEDDIVRFEDTYGRK